MATVLEVQSVWGANGTAYKRNTDWTDNGAGSIAVVVGSALETYLAAAGTLTIQRASYSDVAPTGPFTYELDMSYSGVMKLANPSSTYSGGTAISIDQLSLHIVERGAGGQSVIRFNCWADDATAQTLAIDDVIAVRIGTINYAGTTLARHEWRGQIVKIDPIVSTDGERQFAVQVSDFSTAIRQKDIGVVRSRIPAYLITIPGDTGGPSQTTLGGPETFRLSDLITLIKPANVTIELNAPDVQIERLPERGDGLDLLANVLNATGYYMYWEVLNEAATLVIEAHDHSGQLTSTVVTDSHVFEVKVEIAAKGKDYTAVEVHRPEEHANKSQQAQPPGDLPPQGETGAFTMPDYSAMVEEDTPTEETVYRANFTWQPAQEFINQEPGPIYLAFSDAAYNVSGRSSAEIYTWLKTKIAKMVPSTRYTEAMISNYAGLDYYFIFQPNSVFIQSANDFADGWIVSRAGWLGERGAISAVQIPVANAVVYLIGASTGVVYQTRTNAAGYYRVDNAEQDTYSPSVYLDDDSYLANKNDQYTEGHPYDDDPANDETGPDTSVAVDNLYQVLDTIINFSVTAHIPSLANDDLTTDFEQPLTYQKGGKFQYGDNTGDVLVVGDGDLVTDTANITSDLQARQFAERKLDRQAEQGDALVITKPFGGYSTRVGQVIQVDTTTDKDITEKCRVMAREIKIQPDGMVIETVSADVNGFLDEMQKGFARIAQVERTNSILHKQGADLYRRLDEIMGLLPTGDQSGVSGR